MPEPEVETTDQTADEVQDDELSRAWEEVTTGKPATEPEVTEEPGETAPVEEEPTEEVVPDEPIVEEPSETPKESPKDDDHKDRTRLGRKVAKLEDLLASVVEQNKLLIERMQTPAKPEPDVNLDEIDVSTPEGLDYFLTKREEKRAQQARSAELGYMKDYHSSIKGWLENSDVDEKDAEAIHKILIDETPGNPFNVRHSSNAKSDFELNLAKAEAHYYRTKAKAPEKKNPLERNTEPPKKPLGVAGGGKTEPPKAKPSMSFTPVEREYIRSMGLTEEEAAKIILGG